MGLTYTSAQHRARLGATRLGTARLAWTPAHTGLLATAIVSAFAIALCCAGRLRALDAADASLPAAPVDLSASATADALAPVTALAFATPADARFAARELARALAADEARSALTNVGALAQLAVPAEAIDGTRGLVTYAERLRVARARSAVPDEALAIPLLTPGDLRAMKPALAVRTRSAYRQAVFFSAVALLLAFQIVSLGWSIGGIAGDRVMLAAAHLLTTIGALAVLSRPDPLRDTLLLVRYSQSVLLGSVLCLGASRFRDRWLTLLQFRYVTLAAAVLLALAVAVFGSGPGGSGAKVNLGPVQPVEAIRLLLAFFLAGYLGRRWELIRTVRETNWRRWRLPAWIDMPRLAYLLPVLAGVGAALVLFFVLHDLGPALLLALLVLALLAVARAGVAALIAGAAVLAGGVALGSWLGVSATLTARTAMWQSPWANTVVGGDQIAQAAWALATGGVTGTGLGLGDTRFLPAGHTDLALAAIGEELGLAGLLVVAAAAAILVWRGLRAARRAPSDAAFFLGVALTLLLVLPMLVMASGILGLLPLTGVVTPFVSYGGSAMLANFAALGLLATLASRPSSPVDAAPFAAPVRWLGRGLALAGLVVVAVAARVQTMAAGETAVRPQLGIQADGGVRFQYNPRVLAVARTLPRAAIRDRRDVPLAAGLEAARGSERALAALGISLREVCPDPAARCYPFGGRTFHLLGDADTRLNWSATNTSYVERDAEAALRGFDDHAVTVRTDSPEPGAVALRRDYAGLLPLLRHRWDPDDPAVAAMARRAGDVRLTIDAELQSRIAALVARSAAAAGVSRAAVVVVDAATGELLASVSYPWPSLEPGAAPSHDALMDRARYGLYPPGSTFKLITAAAALRLDPEAARTTFTCQRVSPARVGVKVPGWSRPILDDERDHEPHGTLAMHDAMVRSCNAYFAQLAIRIGREPLADAAGLAGLVFPATGSAAHLRELLPQAGYGQGEVLTTPLRMARVVAAIASDGAIREPSIVRGAAPPDPRRFLPASSAHLLAGYMRDVVTTGTGRLLRGHAVSIAGKTGTAQVDGQRSHAWFVGFAPAGEATKRIAFSVILENGGYGGASAAALAGQVVTAASALGYAR